MGTTRGECVNLRFIVSGALAFITGLMLGTVIYNVAITLRDTGVCA